MDGYRIHRPGLRVVLVAIICIAGFAISLFRFHAPLVACMFFGGLFGNLMTLIRRPAESMEPIGRGWKVVWAICVLAALASFVGALFDWPTLGFGALFTIVAGWGFLIHRYRERMLLTR